VDLLLFFRNKARNAEDQLAYADYYRREEEAATMQQLVFTYFYVVFQWLFTFFCI